MFEAFQFPTLYYWGGNKDLEPEVGMALSARGQDGQEMRLTVTEVKDDSITVDGNHPLAGQPLNFAIELVNIA